MTHIWHWQLDLGVVDGKRVQRAFATKQEALDELTKARAARKKHGEQAVSLTTAEIGEVVRCKEQLAECGASLADETRNNYLGDARAMCAWAVEQGWLHGNPCLKIEKAREVRDEIGTLST